MLSWVLNPGELPLWTTTELFIHIPLGCFLKLFISSSAFLVRWSVISISKQGASCLLITALLTASIFKDMGQVSIKNIQQKYNASLIFLPIIKLSSLIFVMKPFHGYLLSSFYGDDVIGHSMSSNYLYHSII